MVSPLMVVFIAPSWLLQERAEFMTSRDQQRISRPADQQVVDGREVIGTHALAAAHVGNTHRAGHEALIDPDAQQPGQARGPGAKQPAPGSAIAYAWTLQHVAKVARPGC